MGRQKFLQNVEDSLHKKSKKRAWFFFLFFSLSLSIGAYFVWHFFQSPAIGTIRTGSLEKRETNFDQGTETKFFSGEYFSFSYPGRYEEVSHILPKTGPIRETVFLSATDVEGKKIAVTFEERAESTLDASPAFTLRRNDKKNYKQSTLSFGGLDRILFTKDSQVFEKTLFFQEKNYFLIISVSSPFSSETLTQDLENTLQDLSWKKEK